MSDGEVQDLFSGGTNNLEVSCRSQFGSIPEDLPLYEESLGQSCTEDNLLAYHCYFESFMVFRDVRKDNVILCVLFLMGKQDELE